jgi:hypothetical protein
MDKRACQTMVREGNQAMRFYMEQFQMEEAEGGLCLKQRQQN